MNEEIRACQQFDSGQFNEICRAYLIIAMLNMEVPQDMAMHILCEMGDLMDTITAEEALKVVRGE